MAQDGYKSCAAYSRSSQYRFAENHAGDWSDNEVNNDDSVSSHNEVVVERSGSSSEQDDVPEYAVDLHQGSMNQPQSPVLSESEQDEEENRMDIDSIHDPNSSGSDTDSDEDLARIMQIDDEDDGGEVDEINDREELLYNGAPITTAESCMSILNLTLRHNLNGEQLTDILRLVNLHCPDGNHCKTTLYKFKKYFAQTDMPLVRHYYCLHCFSRVRTENSVCGICEIESPSNSYFLEVPVIPQLEALYKRPGFHQLLQHRFTRERTNAQNYEDMYDGEVYKDLSKVGGFLQNRDNISLTCYADGIRIFRSSKYNIWVVDFVINELPFDTRFRKENVLLGAIWFGDSKPVMNVLLEPLIASIQDLRIGIDVHIPHVENALNIKAIVICITCDLPAKAQLHYMHQYNGRFGCQKCKQMGLYLHESRVRVYPHEPFHLRTDEETHLHVQQAIRDRTSVCGVKGPSALSDLVHQRVRATAVDVMHCVFEGVAKSLMELWFSAKQAHQRWSLHQHLDLIDQRLTSLTPPSSNQRLPRSIKEHLPYWKAHESKVWFFFFSIPCLNDVMDDEYFNHYKLLVLGISILCQSSIDRGSLDIASRALEEFSARFEYFYDLRNMTNNLHQLRHLVNNVREFGPLWTTSCFPFEDLNGILKRLVHGSKAAQLQICSAVSMYMNLSTLKSEELREGRPATSFCESMDYRCGRIKQHQIIDSVYIVGKCRALPELSADLRCIFERQDIQGRKYFYFLKLLKKRVMFSSIEYTRSKRTNSSSAVFLSEDGSYQIGQIKCFIRVQDCVCERLCFCMSRHYAVLRRCVFENEFTTCIDNNLLSNIHTISHIENVEFAVDIARLKYVCYYCNISNNRVDGDPERLRRRTYIIEPVNLVEFE